MSTDSSNVRVAGSGEISVGATSATAPTATGSLPVGFSGLGYLSEDGTTESRERSVETIRAWQNSDTVRSVVTDASLTFTFTLIETTLATVELFYGADVTQAVAHGSWVVTPGETGGEKSFILDVIDGDELVRIYVPRGEITEVGDVMYANGTPIGYEVTLTTYPDSGIGGNAKYFATALKS